ncbi:MAG: TRAP transporter small permease subunit [Dehalococcoidia bacterium]
MFKQMMEKLDHAISRVSFFLLGLSGFLVVVMAFLATYGVARRYIFQSPESYSYEIATMFLLFSGVLAVAEVERRNRNVKNDMISSRFPPKMQIVVLDIIFPLLALTFTAVLTWKSLGNALYALDIGQTSKSTWAVPLAPIKLVIPFGYTLLCIVLFGKVCRGISGLFKSSKEPSQTDLN